MKFRRGAWLWNDGVDGHVMRRVTEYRIEGDSVWLALLDRMGTDHSDRFEGVVLQMRISSPLPEVIRVQTWHHAPDDRPASKFDLDYSLKSSEVQIVETDDEIVFTSGQASLRITRRGEFRMRFCDDDHVITFAGHESLATMETKSGSHMMHRLNLGVGECIYGMGERFGPLVKNGQSVEIYNEDGGTASEIAYKNVPFYLSNRGYGLLVNSPAKVEFEVATERVTQIQMSVPGESLDYYFFYGPDPKDVLSKYTQLAGRPAIIPAWSFGLWLSTSFTTQYTEATVNEFVDGMIARGIPLQVFHFDCFWMKQRHWCDFEWDREAFPDPVGMIQRLKRKGLKICVWINPYVSSMSKIFEEGKRHGYFLKRDDGSVYQADQWQPGMAYVDFTNPAAVQWYQSKLRRLLDMGVDSFKTDFGERIPLDAVYHDGSDPRKMRNFYSYLYNKCVFELLEDFHGKDNALVFARSATTGCQKFPVHWGGDCEATFESMSEDLRGGLSFCLSGAAFWSHDIGGFSGTASASLYKRWVAFGLLSTHSRLHGSSSYRVPWLFDEEAVDVMRHFAKLKNRLFPYLYSAAQDAHRFGWPVMRAMMLEYPEDPNCAYLDRQYMLGEALLVAPVFREDDFADYYLPRGQWTNLLSGKVVNGGQWRREKMDFFHLPLFVRANTILPMSENEMAPEWRALDELVLNLIQIEDGAKLKTDVISSDRHTHATFSCRRNGSQYILDGNGAAKCLKVLVRGHKGGAEKVSNGMVLAQTADGLLLRWIDTAAPISFTLIPSAADAVELSINRDALRPTTPR
jgi:alpha-D-xyloside xylohydrolase